MNRGEFFKRAALFPFALKAKLVEDSPTVGPWVLGDGAAEKLRKGAIELRFYSDYRVYRMAKDIALFSGRYEITPAEFEYLKLVAVELDGPANYYGMGYEWEVMEAVKEKFELTYKDPREYWLEWAQSGKMDEYIAERELNVYRI